MENQEYIGTTEAAKLLGISRVAVFKKIKSDEIKAKKVGRNYIIEKKSLGSIYKELTKAEEKEVEKAVTKVVKEFGPALRKLGKE